MLFTVILCTCMYIYATLARHCMCVCGYHWLVRSHHEYFVDVHACMSVCVCSTCHSLQVVGVKQVEGGDPVKFSKEVLFTADRYEIV